MASTPTSHGSVVIQSKRQVTHMHSQLPQEMINQITEYLHTDTKSLLTCSLISRAWVGAVRDYIFRTTHLRTVKQAQAFLRLLKSKTSSHIAHYVKDLTVLPGFDPGLRYFVAALLSIAPKLVKLNRLKFGLPHFDVSPQKNLAVLNLFSSIHTLVLSSFTFYTYQDFVKMLRAHPKLTDLHMKSTRLEESFDTSAIATPYVEEIKISTLVVSDCVRQPHFFNKIMRDGSTSITHLEMGPPAHESGGIDTICVSPCTSLCALSFDLTIDTIFGDNNWPIKILSQVASTSVRKITFYLLHRRIYQYRRAIDWKGIKDVLSRHPFVSLKQIIVSCPIPRPGETATNEEQLWSEEIRREMNGLDEEVSIIIKPKGARSDW